ncbi:PAAR domain-containing protein [Aquimarina longa]|uniref:PAAR domain-containing protein n=1 Tax=Aquimarina longa TaxID=1080221 RepID=UPI0009E9B879
MSAKPVATLGSTHQCPMYTGTVPHVGGTITTGDPTVLMNGKPVAVLGSLCTCVGATNTVVQGQAFVFINGKPVACVGDMTAHGGTITSGEANITYTAFADIAPITMPIHNIPFPEITLVNRILGNTRVAQQHQDALREDPEEVPKVVHPRWIKDETILRNSHQIRQLTLVAEVSNIPDGNTATLTFSVPEVFNRPEETVTLSGEVHNKQIEVIWEIEDLQTTT